MKKRIGYQIALYSLFIMSGLISTACNKAAPRASLLGSPMPTNKTSLQEVHFKENSLQVSYLRGHSMTIANTLREGKPVVGQEPLAFMDTCEDKTPLQPGELRFEQFSYKAQGQAEKLSLDCELMPVSEEWLETFLEAFPQCLDKGLKTIGWDQPLSVVVHSVMIYTHKGRGNRLSLHAPARAVDMKKLELVYADKNRDLVVAMANKKNNPFADELTAERKFYETFRRCWDDYLEEKNGCKAWKKDGYRGSVGWEDGNHQNHLHLSRPYCPSNTHFLSI